MRATADEVKRVLGHDLSLDREALYKELDLRRRRAQIAARHAVAGGIPPSSPARAQCAPTAVPSSRVA